MEFVSKFIVKRTLFQLLATFTLFRVHVKCHHFPTNCTSSRVQYTNWKRISPLTSKNQINFVLILDFDIRGFFGLGMHHELFPTSLTFLQFNTEMSHSRSVPLLSPFSRLDKVDETQWSNGLLFNEYWTQHVSSALLRHLTFHATALPYLKTYSQNHHTYATISAQFGLITQRLFVRSFRIPGYHNGRYEQLYSRAVLLMSTDVSEEHVTSAFRFEG
jgi:hypothetical protein